MAGAIAGTPMVPPLKPKGNPAFDYRLGLLLNPA
jgi:hypothetical protein